MDFESIPRGHARHLVMLPGWGFDGRVFSRLDLPYDYVVTKGLSSPDLTERLRGVLDDMGIRTATLLGWSMGAHLALDFHAQYPSRVDALLLFSLRKAFPQEAIRAEAEALVRDRRAALRRFYRRCFLGQGSDYARFAEELEGVYLEQWGLEGLLSGLDYLKARRLDLSAWSGCSMRVFSGGRDVICPPDEMPPLPRGVAPEVWRGYGHLPFLADDFGLRFCEYYLTAETRSRMGSHRASEKS